MKPTPARGPLLSEDARDKPFENCFQKYFFAVLLPSFDCYSVTVLSPDAGQTKNGGMGNGKSSKKTKRICVAGGVVVCFLCRGGGGHHHGEGHEQHRLRYILPLYIEQRHE